MEERIVPAAGELGDWLVRKLAGVLNLTPDDIDPTVSFNAHGLGSADAVGIAGELEEWLGVKLPDTALYEYPTVEALTRFLTGDRTPPDPVEERAGDAESDPVCVVGMACRFPGGSDSPASFWNSLVRGEDASADVPPERWTADDLYSQDPDAPGKAYTRRGGFIRDIAGFDAGFFGISPREAVRMDPQQRQLLEVAWEALEDAGIAADRLRETSTGVFVGMMGSDQYASLQLQGDGRRVIDDPYFGLGTAPSVISGRLSYLLDLRGPSVCVDTACSSALVGLDLAVQSLLRGDGGLAIVGGVSAILHPDAYVQACRMRMLAQDGRCKTFDRTADGFLMGEGCGVVVLERMSEALRRGHRIQAVIRGSAVNQDGASNGLTAPNGAAQSRVIRAAQRRAGITPAMVGYVEAHGSGTLLGDAIEIGVLDEVFGGDRPPGAPLAVGAVKTNVGHLIGASGMAGLIKAILAVRHGQIPGNLHLSDPNPAVSRAGDDLLLPGEPMPWPLDAASRIAGVSSFGWSGTNAHVVIADRPEPPRPPRDDEPQLLTLSARTDTALGSVARRLLDRLGDEPAPDMRDVAFTLQTGRSGLERRAGVVCRDAEDARAQLAGLLEAPRATGRRRGQRVALTLPGTGDQYPGATRELYDAEPVFRAVVDECAGLLDEPLGLDLRSVLYPETADRRTAGGLSAALGRDGAARRPDPAPSSRTDVSHAAVFVLDYAVARLWRHWGIRPTGLLGYSLGEYVAACLSGVFTLEDALRLVVRRARLVQKAPDGMMLTVARSARDIGHTPAPGVWTAVDAGPLMCVLAGEETALAALADRFTAEGIACQRVPGTIAMHTPMLDPQRAELTELIREIQPAAPAIPFVSNRTGAWITEDQARDPAYWAEHMCRTVRFAEGVRTLAADADVLLEAGPGQLTSIAAQVTAGAQDRPLCLPSVRPAPDAAHDRAYLLRTAGSLWERGVDLDWPRLHEGRDARIVSLPTYPFEHQRFWPSAPAASPSTEAPLPTAGPAPERRRPADWVHAPEWRPEDPDGSGTPAGPYLLFVPDAEMLPAEWGVPDDQVCVRVVPGDRFAELGPDLFAVRPDDPADYEQLMSRLSGRLPRTVVHVWLHTDEPAGPVTATSVRDQQRLGLMSLLMFGKAFAPACAAGLRLLVVTGHGPGRPAPGTATVLGPCLVLPQEHPGLSCRWLDLPDGADPVAPIRAELSWPGGDTVITYRDGRRCVREYVQVATEPRPDPGYRDQGVYLITGGLGTLGLRLARHIAAGVRAPRCVLVGRTGLPPREQWEQLLAEDADGRATERIRQVLELESAGARVEVEAADVADPAQMRDLVARVKARFGAVHGVVHAAGLTDPAFFETVQHLRTETVDAHLAGKVYGTLALAEALEGEPLDFAVMVSSMSAVLGGLGFAAYAAANAFLDGFAALQGPWRSVNWDTWRADDGLGELGDALARYSMSAEEGLELFDRTLSSRHGRLTVATDDLTGRLAAWTRSTDPFGEAESGRREDRAGGVLHPRPTIQEEFVPAKTDYERRVAALWRDALGIEEVGVNDNFFDLGGNSLIGTQLMAGIRREFGLAVPATAIFEAPTVAAMAGYLLPDEPSRPAVAPRSDVSAGAQAADIAVIGMAGRFPGAADVDRFWRNLADGVESTRFFTTEELVEAGVPEEFVRQANYVRARPVLDDIAAFDAEFFGYSPWEARLTDPQHRVFLECSWEALENAGYAPRSYPGTVGVFTGANISTYLPRLYQDPETAATLNDYQVVISNDKDALPLSVSYKLNLRGPSMAVQTFCSTSLVATHLACRALIFGECDMALAGGVSIRVPDRLGYFYEEGGMESPDGHVRTFDAAARGAVFGDGAGVVVLKRLPDALADGDSITAVIKGSAVNNDGSLKVGFTAPSVTGQAEVVSRALAAAGVDAGTVSYVEAHGTATELGDPIEVAALTRAFNIGDRPRSIALGSVKSNVGHLDRAAGVTGLIKTVLSMRHRAIPPSLHFTEPNPAIDFDSGPFYVNDRLSEWRRAGGTPLRAGVTSLGMGGTNAHVVLEEAPPPAPTAPGRDDQVLVLSARSEAALAEARGNLLRHLDGVGDDALADLAFTLQAGRERFEHRAAVVARDVAGVRRALEGDGTLLMRRDQVAGRPVAFVLPDAPGYDLAAAAGLDGAEPRFTAELDACAEAARPLAGELREAMFTEAAPGDPVRHRLAVFSVEYALARTLLHWGVRPETVLGQGVGEYVAACVAGILTLEDALSLAAGKAASGSADQAARDGAASHGMTGVRPARPSIPCLSSVTGTWITGEQATDPAFWTRRDPSAPDEHAAAVAVLLSEPSRMLVELGPGTVLDGAAAPDPDLTAAGLPARRDGHDAPRDANAASPAQGHLQAVVARLWLAGVTIDWSSLHEVPRRRVPAPTYPFQRQRFWIDTGPALPQSPPAHGLQLAREHPDDWFYQPVWRQTTAPWLTSAPSGDWLVFADGSGVGDALGEALRSAGCAVSLVRPGERYGRTGHEFTVSGSREDLGRLLAEAAPTGAGTLNIVHAWSLDEMKDTGGKLERGLFSVLSLAQALGDSAAGECTLTVISAGAYDVTGRDDVDPCAATLAGPARVLPIEYQDLRCRQIDIAVLADRVPADVNALLRELDAGRTETVVALRAGRRWVPAFERLEPAPIPPPTEVLRRNGVYLIVGGLGGIGLELARRLHDEVGARLVLVGRTGLPETGANDAHTGAEVERRAAAVRELRAAGAEVLVVAADVSRPTEVQRVVGEARTRFGRIDGVVHAAGVPGVGLTQFKSMDSVAGVLAPKVHGADALLAGLVGIPLDFLVLFSSTAALTGGGPGQVDYCAANGYLDSCAHAARSEGPPTFTVNWGEWQWNAWDDGLEGFDDAATAFLRENRERVGITFDEGWRAFLRVLAMRSPQLAVSSQDLPALVAATSGLRLGTLTGANSGGERHPRPELSTPYTAPADDATRRVAEIWAETLGLTEVGLHDDFFELGGNSLLGVTMVGKVRRALDCPALPPHVLYEAPTVASLVECARRDGTETRGPDAGGVLRGERRRRALGERSGAR